MVKISVEGRIMNRIVQVFLIFSMLSSSQAIAIGVVAHRGASAEAPENTLAAFRRAIDLGVDMIELDLQLSRDGVPVAIHDTSIARTCDPSREEQVHQLSLDELRKLDAGSWFDGEFRGEKLPLLLEILSLKRGKTGLMLELKAGAQLAEELVSAVKLDLECEPEWTATSPIVLGSQDIPMVQALLQQFPREQIVGIAPDNATLEVYQDLGLKKFSIYHGLATPERMKSLTQDGCSVWVWTVDDPQLGHKLTEAGAIGIITNDPRTMKTRIQAPL